MPIISSALIPSILLGYAPPIPIPTGPGLHVVDVGQGSALIVRGREGDTVIVDSGPAGAAEALMHALALHHVDRVALWIHTHHDADHIGGFSRVVAGADRRWPSADDLTVEVLWDRGVDQPLPDSDAFLLYRTIAGEARVQPEAGSVFAAAGLRVEVLALDPPPAAAPENRRGLALCLEVEGLRALLPGDLPADQVEQAAQACDAVDVLWLSHHGAVDGSSAAALALADPRLVVIGAGHDNGYCHPAPATLALLAERRVWLLDGAGVGPGGDCPPLADAAGPEHRVVGGDLWITPDLRLLAGAPGAGFVSP